MQQEQETAAAAPRQGLEEVTAPTGDSSKGKKRMHNSRCGSCRSCVRGDCGECKHCLEMLKFGGCGILKKGCVQRICCNPQARMEGMSPPESSAEDMRRSDIQACVQLSEHRTPAVWLSLKVGEGGIVCAELLPNDQPAPLKRKSTSALSMPPSLPPAKPMSSDSDTPFNVDSRGRVTSWAAVAEGLPESNAVQACDQYNRKLMHAAAAAEAAGWTPAAAESRQAVAERRRRIRAAAAAAAAAANAAASASVIAAAAALTAALLGPNDAAGGSGPAGEVGISTARSHEVGGSVPDLSRSVLDLGGSSDLGGSLERRGEAGEIEALNVDDSEEELEVIDVDSE